MNKIEKFEDIAAWQKARELTRLIYEASQTGNFGKDFGLKDQARRAALSVMANIAEGFERGGDKEFAQFLSLAKGSCGELRSHLDVALDQKYLSPEQFQKLYADAERIGRMLAGFMTYLRTSNLGGVKYKRPQPRDLRPETQDLRPKT